MRLSSEWNLVSGNIHIRSEQYDVAATARSFESAIRKFKDAVRTKLNVETVDLKLHMASTADIFPASSLVLSVSGEAGAHGPIKQDHLFEGGYCEFCDAPLGSRTRNSCKFSELPSADGAQNWCRGGNQLFSDRFLALLTPEEREGLSTLPVDGPSLAGRQMLELVGNSIAPLVAPKAFHPSSRKCEACGQAPIYFLPRSGSPFFSYLAEEAPSRMMPSCFVAGEPSNLKLCMVPERWANLVGEPGTQGLAATFVGVIEGSEVDTSPAFEIATKESFLRMKRKGSNRSVG